MCLAKIPEILNILDKTYPNAKCGLNFTTPFELLVAVVLSARTTDKQVNLVTSKLFSSTKPFTPQKVLDLGQAALAHEIKSIGLYHTKSQNIYKLAKLLLSNYAGHVPQTRLALESLPGVGRKTANVVLSTAFNFPALAVDTHVMRVATRLGLTHKTTPFKIEADLTKKLPKNIWIKFHHQLITHGRTFCKKRKPKCHICPLQTDCTYFNKLMN
ncbi:MAG: endonuclease [Bacillota bacterium]|jgi:endonuclease-3